MQFPTESRSTFHPEFFLTYAVVMAISSVAVGILLILLATLFYPNFNWIGNTLSNMGNVTRGHEYNSASLLNGAYIIAGLGTLPLYLHYARIYRYSTHRGLRLGGKMTILPPINIALLGICSENFDLLHIVVSNLFFLLIALTLLFLALGWLHMPGERKWAAFNLVVLFSAVGMWLVYFTIFAGTSVNQALFEFATDIDYMILAVAYSYKAYRLGLKI